MTGVADVLPRGLLLPHSHATAGATEDVLAEVTLAPPGVLGACAGWGRWLERRLPGAARVGGRLWTA